MKEYAITGIWKDGNDVITHYVIHQLDLKEGIIKRAERFSKNQALILVGNPNNDVYTAQWDYLNRSWTVSEPVYIVRDKDGNFLRSNPDNKLTNNLEHLIEFSLLENAFR